MSKTANRFSTELLARAVRLAFDHEKEYSRARQRVLGRPVDLSRPFRQAA